MFYIFYYKLCSRFIFSFNILILIHISSEIIINFLKKNNKNRIFQLIFIFKYINYLILKFLN